MIVKFPIRNLRNPEHLQFMRSARDIFGKHDIVRVDFESLLEGFDDKLKIAEVAMVTERKNDKVREKNDADNYRDCMHSKLYCYLKSILYDVNDPRYGDAQIIMKVVKETGNPTQLSENAESAMLTALCEKLEPFQTQAENIGADEIIIALYEANQNFIVIEKDYRKMLSEQKLDVTHMSMSAARRLIDPLYRAMVNAINGIAGVPSKMEECRELIAEMNVLVGRYDAVLNARKNKEEGDCATDVVPPTDGNMNEIDPENE